jgi:hypothetical protein
MRYTYHFSCMLAGFAFLIGGGTATAQSSLKDSVIISFNEQTRMVIYGTDRKEIAKLSQYDFNRLIRDVLQKLDSVTPGDTLSVDWVDGKRYLKPDSAKLPKSSGDQAPPSAPVKRNEGWTGERADVSEGRRVVQITQTITEEDGRIETVSDTVFIKPARRWGRRSPRQGIDIKLGLNTYSKRAGTGYDLSDLDLRSGASRYLSVGLVRSIPLVKGRKNNFFMDVGMDVSWYNLMFEGDQVIRKESESIAFESLLGANGQELSLKKNKLVAPHLNLSLMPTLSFAGSVMSHVSAGAYAGYRLGGYQASRIAGERKVRNSGDYHMQELRYGFALELGIRSFPDLFVNYDLNGLFDPGRGPQVRMVSFGVKI